MSPRLVQPSGDSPTAPGVRGQGWTKLVRLGVMAELLLDEIRRAPLDPGRPATVDLSVEAAMLAKAVRQQRDGRGPR